jgi:hypothetical protein
MLVAAACRNEFPIAQIYPNFCVLDLELQNQGYLVRNGQFPSDTTSEFLLADGFTKLVTLT